MSAPAIVEDVTFPADALLVKRLTQTARLPSRGSEGAVGYDLCADLPDGPMVLAPGLPDPGLALPIEMADGPTRALIPTGIAVAIPPGFYGRIAPRSGLAVKAGIDTMAGVVDPDFRGELRIVLVNLGQLPFTVKHGDRVAQLVIEAVATPAVVEVGDLDITARGAGGFGSTGMNA